MGRAKRAEWAVSGVVEAAAKDVWRALLHALPGLSDKADEIIGKKGVQRISVTPADEPYERHYEINDQERSVALEGQWWYRGEYSVTAQKGTSLLIYQVYNIAPGYTRWLVPLMERGSEGRLKREFQLLLEEVGKYARSRTRYRAK